MSVLDHLTKIQDILKGVNLSNLLQIAINRITELESERDELEEEITNVKRANKGYAERFKKWKDVIKDLRRQLKKVGDLNIALSTANKKFSEEFTQMRKEAEELNKE